MKFLWNFYESMRKSWKVDDFTREQLSMAIRSQRALEPRGVSMNMETSWAAEGLATISGLHSLVNNNFHLNPLETIIIV